MDTENLNKIISSFEDVGINVPTKVRNSFEDVFQENDSIADVSFYDVNDLDEFQKVLSITNTADIYIDGRSVGEKSNIYIYLGDISFALSEHVNLYGKDGELIEEIVNFDDVYGTRVEVPTEWAIILKEIVSWDTSVENGPITQRFELFVYCPEVMPDYEDEEDNQVDQYDAVYGNGE